MPAQTCPVAAQTGQLQFCVENNVYFSILKKNIGYLRVANGLSFVSKNDMLTESFIFPFKNVCKKIEFLVVLPLIIGLSFVLPKKGLCLSFVEIELSLLIHENITNFILYLTLRIGKTR